MRAGDNISLSTMCTADAKDISCICIRSIATFIVTVTENVGACLPQHSKTQPLPHACNQQPKFNSTV